MLVIAYDLKKYLSLGRQSLTLVATLEFPNT